MVGIVLEGIEGLRRRPLDEDHRLPWRVTGARGVLAQPTEGDHLATVTADRLDRPLRVGEIVVIGSEIEQVQGVDGRAHRPILSAPEPTLLEESPFKLRAVRVAVSSTLVLILVIALTAALTPGSNPLAPGVAEATHGKRCGAVAKGKNDFLVVAKRVDCVKARRGASKYLRKGKKLRGFRCKDNVGVYRFVCKKNGGKRSYRAQKL